MGILDSFQPAYLPASAEALRADVRAFCQAQLKDRRPRDRARTWTAWGVDFSRRLAAKGWIGLGLPKAYGGQELDAFHRFAVVEELLVAGAPVAAHWIGERQSAPLICRFGTEAQRQRFVPAICRAEIFFCIGMSEPGSGSDLASVRTKAVRVDGGWRLNGRKIWTTHAHNADWMIALVRTSGGPEKRREGLSQFLVDLKAPGVSVQPIALLTGDAEFSEVTFDDVFLLDDTLLGAEGDGWVQVTAELAFERSGPERMHSSTVLLDLWAQSLEQHAEPGDIELLGQLTARLATLREMSIALTAQLVAGESPVQEAALYKDLGTTFEQSVPARIAERLAADASPELLATLGYLQQLAPVFSLRGGTREILRGMIARGLGVALMFLEAFTQILDAQCPPSLVRASETDAEAAAPLTFAIAAAEFDRILLPEDAGGAGLSLAEFAPLVMACGRYLCPVDFPEQAVAKLAGIDAAGICDVARAALVAARMAGAIEKLLDMTIAHVTTREQFGRPLGNFQAIQQQLSQFAEEAAAARLAASIGLGGAEFTLARSATAKLRCNEAAGFAAATAHQLHGAIGATAEYDLQLYSRALWRWQREAGSSIEWAARLGRDRLQKKGPMLPYLQQYLQSGESA